MEHVSNRYLQRARQHRWEDGVAEIFIGLGGMLYAAFEMLYTPLIGALPDNITVRIIFSTFISLLVVAVGLTSFHWAAERVKAHTSYPRTGLVELRRRPTEWSPRKVVFTLLIALLSIIVSPALVIGLMILGALVKINAGLLLMSAMFAASAAAMGWQVKLPRLYWLAGGILLIGVGLTVTNTFGQTGISLLFGLAGLLTLLSGGIALARYLHDHPVEASA